MYMKVLVTGAKGFVGKNLVESLKNIKDGKDRTRPNLLIEDIYEFDIDTDINLLDEYCKNCDFVFNLAGVNRPKDVSEFMSGNFGFASTLLNKLKENNNKCPVMLSSSIQAKLDNDYGKSKLEGEKLFFQYSKENDVKVLVYRFPNLFGKWCRPNYNSVIATWCNNIANDLDIQINDPTVELELCYIDDVVIELLDALENKEHKDGDYNYIPCTHKITLGKIAELLKNFAEQPKNLIMPDIPNNSFEKKLYSTYLSYLPHEKFKFELTSNVDERGSFTELLKTANNGQFSVNISKPGITKGQHWHNSKWEFFIVVKGTALIQERNLHSNEVIEFQVSGEKLEAIHMIPGYTHNIINLSDTEDLITLMWANEIFDKNHPDTFYEEVNNHGIKKRL
ncbi:MAG: capsular polysaccharide biosynthesis protein CapF [Bacilli bacterium]|nr:capsular polysaccharide biosynthesis protein CapF [Bacilli bacterium]